MSSYNVSRPLKTVLSISSLVVASLWSAVVPINAQVNVTQYHNNSSRDGLYIDSAFTQSAAANLTRDLNFDGTIVGNVLTQPLYIEGGPNGPMIIIATSSNNVYALDPVNGTIIWQRNVGPPVPANNIFCTEVGSAGITGTPVVDLASRALFLDALTTPDGGATLKLPKLASKYMTQLPLTVKVCTGAGGYPGIGSKPTRRLPCFEPHRHAKL
jgi:hypothetical protein